MVCKPEDSKAWYEKLWRYSVELFRSLDIPVRQLECCSGDLADLKCKSCDIEAWSPRQQKYFEVCSCSNLGDAQARRLKIRYKDENGRMQLCHTLNNTCVAPPRMLIAFLENNLQPDGTVLIPKVLQPTWAAARSWFPNADYVNSRRIPMKKFLSEFKEFALRATCWTWPSAWSSAAPSVRSPPLWSTTSSCLWWGCSSAASIWASWISY